MASRDIACRAEQIFCDAWPVQLVEYDEPWSVVRDSAGPYRALTRLLRTARRTPPARPFASPKDFTDLDAPDPDILTIFRQGRPRVEEGGG